MQLSKYFSLQELTFSQTAARKGLDNTPNTDMVETLRHTAQQLDAVRELLGKPIMVSSGYRSPKVNAAVGSKSSTSAHTLGYAVDFICPGYGDVSEVFASIKASGIQYDQVILECPKSNGGWVHISFDPRYRKQALVTDDATNYRFA